jgi:hypothetical protein
MKLQNKNKKCNCFEWSEKQNESEEKVRTQ